VQDAPANDVPSSEFQPDCAYINRKRDALPIPVPTCVTNDFAADSRDGATSAAADTPTGLK
jgi:hypothetical protein